MCTNNNQLGHTLFENNDNQYKIDQLLSVEIANTNQPSVQLTTPTMTPSQRLLILADVQEKDIMTKRQQGRVRRRLQRRQCQREQQKKLRQQQAEVRAFEQWLERQGQDDLLLENFNDMADWPDLFEEPPMYEIFNESSLLKMNDLKRIDPNETFEEEQWNEMEEMTELEQQELIQILDQI